MGALEFQLATNRDLLRPKRAAEIEGEDVRFSACSLYLHIFSVRIIVQWNAPEIKFRRSAYEETGFRRAGAPLVDNLSLSLSPPLSPLINEINFPRTSEPKKRSRSSECSSSASRILTRIARLRACLDTRLAPMTPVK